MDVPRRTFLRLGLGALVVGAAGCSRLGGTDADAAADPERAPTPSSPGSSGPSTVGTAHDGHGAGAAGPASSRRSTASGGSWSDPATWEGGTVPGGSDDVAVAGPVLLDVDAGIGSLRVLAGASLTFDRSTSATLRSQRNVVVEGLLAVEPADADVVHRLLLTGADESSFVGGGMSVLDTDIGLWVMGDGVLDVRGAPKLAWTRAAGALEAGQRSIAVDQEPSGWRVGDELVVTATLPPDPEEEASLQVDVAEIAGIDGRTVTLRAPLAVAHPAVDVGRGRVFTAEVLNMTRNVSIEGAPEGRAHVFIHSQQPQTVRHAALRHLGPTQPDPAAEREGDTVDVLGRYGLHFHHCGDGSRGSLVEGVVARDLGAHAFVPHESNGTTWRDCIAHDTRDDAYWWDPEENAADVLFERCVASNVGANAPNRYSNSGFLLGQGPEESNVARGCVATGVSRDGFLWDAGDSVWVFEDCVAHNNWSNGIRVWQNNSQAHVLRGTVSYRNYEYGIDHGAYGNAYRYEGGNVAGNGTGAVAVRAVSAAGKDGRGLTFSDLYCDANGAEFAIGLSDGGPVDPALPTMISGCELANASRAGVGWYGDDKNAVARVLDCTFDGNELWLDSAMGAGSRIELSDDRHGQVILAPRDQPGEVVPSWNAVILPASAAADVVPTTEAE